MRYQKQKHDLSRMRTNRAFVLVFMGANSALDMRCQWHQLL